MGATDRGEYRQAAGAFAEAVIRSAGPSNFLTHSKAAGDAEKPGGVAVAPQTSSCQVCVGAVEPGGRSDPASIHPRFAAWERPVLWVEPRPSASVSRGPFAEAMATRTSSRKIKSAKGGLKGEQEP